MKYFSIIFLLTLIGCSKGHNIQDTDIVLINNRYMVCSMVVVSTYNGNSATKWEDCELHRDDANEKYGEKYECHYYKNIAECVVW